MWLQSPDGKHSRKYRASVIALFSLLVSGCGRYPVSTLDAKGPAAARINVLWWLMLGVGVAVALAVFAYLLIALFRPRGERPHWSQPAEGSKVVLWAGGIIPALILVGIFGATLYTMRAVDEPAIDEALTIEVVGNQWWWEVRYPNLQFTTANEIHIPVGQPVALRLTSADVIHSFWVPQLHGKLDLIPGTTTSFWLQADEEGIYWGECAEFCGIQHAKMQFLVIAEEAPRFWSWVEEQHAPAAEPAADSLAQQGQQIFLRAGCLTCHAVAGLRGGGGELGPDLTHLASRRTLAAGTVANTRGNLMGWIANPEGIKPGVLMPPSTLSGEELQALVAYLETLE